MTGSLPTRSRRPVAILFVLSVVALLTTTALTVIAISSADEPEPCCAGPVAEAGALPSPTRPADATRKEGLPHCLIGSWRMADEVLMTKFYTDVDALPLTTSGRYYELRADGTGVERNANINMVGNYQGNELRLVVNGWREFTWTATGTTLTFVAVTKAKLTWSFYDQRGLLETQPEGPRALNELNNYTCSGASVTETDAGGSRSVWSRTTDYGAYG
ncbi:MAG: hypothetical protein GEV28_11220 [Actinophytocola sp.]|uniref:hypothetical protein n=1 Tax=Actinophytocola sp. TaxID=1872138 RepID=UPI001329283D|nr:hypothetical protein [Actinophytocola sp.]MPZ80927.1 hypothetical protein [Actinophytocola sp.]